MNMNDLQQEKLINGLISSPSVEISSTPKKLTREEKLAEVNRRLKTKEAMKARKLLALVASHHQAYQIVRDRIIKEIEIGTNGSNGNNTG
jgi:hypothetical protein